MWILQRKNLLKPKVVAKKDKDRLRLIRSLNRNCEELDVLSQYFKNFKSVHDTQAILDEDYMRINFAKQEILKKTFSNKKVLEMIKD